MSAMRRASRPLARALVSETVTMEASRPIMATTTSNSIKVNPRRIKKTFYSIPQFKIPGRNAGDFMENQLSESVAVRGVVLEYGGVNAADADFPRG